MRKTDRRVRRTRRLLHQALKDLVLEKNYETITVQDITDRADLSRATFYLHYKDKDELLAHSLEEMFDELVDQLKDPADLHDLWIDGESPALIAFRHVQEHHQMYKALLGERGVSYVITREINYLAQIAFQRITAILPQGYESPVPLEILSQHIAGSLYTIIVWWLENDMPHSPEYMARTLHNLSIPGVMNALGLPVDLSNFEPIPLPEGD